MNETDLIVAAGAYLGSKEVIGKLLGPTADYFGGGIKTYTEKGINNINRILKSAVTKLGSRLDDPGAIPPRVIKTVFENGYFYDDQLTTEYLGGVLASSRTCIHRDDRGISFTHLLETLSAYQIRAHYIFYSIFQQAYRGNSANIGRVSICNNMLIFIPQVDFNKLMDFSGDESPTILTSHCITGLDSAGLLNGATWGDQAAMLLNYKIGVNEPGIMLRINAYGIELYHWAHGLGSKPFEKFLIDDFDYPDLLNIDFDELRIQAFNKNKMNT